MFTDCPGTQSESAGKVSACQGCPNQLICSSGAARGPDPGCYYEVVQMKLVWDCSGQRCTGHLK